MPVLLDVHELKAGMTLARNLSNNFSVLLPHGKQLTESNIETLCRKFAQAKVYVVDPLLDETVDFEDDSLAQEVSLEVRRNVATVGGKVSASVRSGVAVDGKHLAGMETVVKEMMHYLTENPVTLALVEQGASWDSYLQEHSANVFYLSLMIGNAIRNYIKQERERLSAARSLHNAMNLTPLATGALLHDLGMTTLEGLYRKEGPLTAEEIQAVRAHPGSGADMLPESVDPMVRLVIRSHHENQNGSGYPEGLPGDRINIFARILRVADAYTAGIAEKSYRKAKAPVVVLHEMLRGSYRRLYDPVVLKIFGTLVPAWPIGGKLKLADGRWAVVVRHNQKNPFDPQIIVAFDELGDPLDKKALEGPFALSEREDIKVVSHGQQDISFLQQAAAAPSEESEPSAQEQQRVMSETFDLMYP